jgi:hypothetical protein
MKITKISLFKNGLGSFLGETDVVDGICKLSFKKDHMADVLKTLSISSEDGNVSPFYVFDTSKTLQDKITELDFSLDSEHAFMTTCTELIGASVSAKLKRGATIKGRMMGIDEEEKDDATELCIVIFDENKEIVSISAHEIAGLAINDEVIKENIDEYLNVLYDENKNDTRTITFVFPKNKKVTKAVFSYMAEIPIWKVSYRLNINNDKSDIACWGLIENGTEQDWHEANLELISNQPISFKYDIYTARYSKRPELHLPDEGGLMPVDFEDADLPTSTPPPGAEPEMELADSFMSESAAPMAGAGIMGKMKAMPAMPKADMALSRSRMAKKEIKTTTTEIDDTTVYHIDTPVDVKKGGTISVQLFQHQVPCEVKSIYNQQQHSVHPLYVIQLTNSTKGSWQTGPLVTYEDGLYKGESMIKNLKPGKDKLFSFALDTELSVVVDTKSESRKFTKAICFQGQLHFSYSEEHTTIYKIKNLAEHKKLVVVEHPQNNRRKIVSPDKYKTTDNFYRFEVEIKPGEQNEFKVKELSEDVNIVQLSVDIDIVDALSWYISSNWLSDNETEMLNKLAEEQSKIFKLSKIFNEKEMKREKLTEDLKRAQENYQIYAPDTEESDNSPEKKQLREKYMRKVADLDTEIDNINDKLDELRGQIDHLKTELGQKLYTLSMIGGKVTGGASLTEGDLDDGSRRLDPEETDGPGEEPSLI